MQITLNIPALFNAFDEIDAAAVDELELDALRRLLSRSMSLKPCADEYESWLFEVFTGQVCDKQKIPYASLMANLDGLAGDSGYWMCADPVYLYADTHSLILRNPRELDLTDAESEELADHVRSLFREYGAVLYTPAPSRWYLHFEETAPQLVCTPLHDALMRPINDYLPNGADGGRWCALLTEIQMLFNQSPVNQQRQSRGAPPVNSLWFWGLGKLPTSADAIFDCCIGDGVYARALCRHAAKRYQTMRQGMVTALVDKSLVLEERLLLAQRSNDPGQWLQALQLAEKEVIAPLVERLHKGSIKTLSLITDGAGYFRCTRKNMRQFWKRLPPASSLLLSPSK